MANSTGSFTVKPNGQTLVVTATYQGGLAGGTATLYSDAAVTSSVTLPQTITADTTYYVATPGTYVVSVKQPDGTELWGKGHNMAEGVAHTIEPVPSAVQVGADVASPIVEVSNLLTSGQTTYPRILGLTQQSKPAATQQLALTYFTANRSETISTVAFISGGTAAGATPTLVRYGIYSESPATGDLTLVASTANDTTLFGATNTKYPKALSVAYGVTKGSRYAVGVLVVSGAAIPTVLGYSGGATTTASTEFGTAPRLSALVTGQSDLPASITNSTLSSSNDRILLYAALT